MNQMTMERRDRGLWINGKLVGACDEALPGCSISDGIINLLRTVKNTKPKPNKDEPTMMTRKITFDEANGFTDENGKPMIDSASAHRICSACASALDPDDFGTVVDMMAETGKLTDAEAKMMKESISSKSLASPAGGAEDRALRSRRHVSAPRLTLAQEQAHVAMFPHANRLK